MEEEEAAEAAKAEIKRTIEERDKDEEKKFREQVDDVGEEVVQRNVPPPHAPNRTCPEALTPCDLEDFSINAKGGPYEKKTPNPPKEELDLEAKLNVTLTKNEAQRRALRARRNSSTLLKRVQIENEILNLKASSNKEMEKADAAVVERAVKTLDGQENLSKFDSEDGHRGPLGK